MWEEKKRLVIRKIKKIQLNVHVMIDVETNITEAW